jgi:hypothetical protein
VKHLLPVVLVVTVSLALVGCRQADGPLPSTGGTVPNELGDLGRDLQNLASGRPDGPQDLADDLAHYADNGAGGSATARELARLLGAALTGKTFTSAQALQLAQTSWLAVAARQLSEKQTADLQAEMRMRLTSMGVSEADAGKVAEQVGVVQKEVTGRHRRWYERL